MSKGADKRYKERARQQKQKDKAADREARKREKKLTVALATGDDPDIAGIVFMGLSDAIVRNRQSGTTIARTTTWIRRPGGARNPLRPFEPNFLHHDATLKTITT